MCSLPYRLDITPARLKGKPVLWINYDTMADEYDVIAIDPFGNVVAWKAEGKDGEFMVGGDWDGIHEVTWEDIDCPEIKAMTLAHIERIWLDVLRDEDGSYGRASRIVSDPESMWNDTDMSCWVLPENFVYVVHEDSKPGTAQSEELPVIAWPTLREAERDLASRQAAHPARRYKIRKLNGIPRALVESK